MQNSVAMFNFSAFDWNYPFWGNLVQIIKIVRLSVFNGMVHLICFRLEIHFLGKFGPKNQNCQFKLKFDT